MNLPRLNVEGAVMLWVRWYLSGVGVARWKRSFSKLYDVFIKAFSEEEKDDIDWGSFELSRIVFISVIEFCTGDIWGFFWESEIFTPECCSFDDGDVIMVCATIIFKL